MSSTSNLSDSTLTVSAFNCRSLKSSISEVRELCDTSDLVLLQEHWLLPFELDQLNTLHPDFFAMSKSAVDVHQSILRGRPYGGTAILFRKTLTEYITPVNSDDPRICALKYASSIGPVLFVCVYMPTDMNDFDSLERYNNTCAKISALFTDSDAVHLAIIGDFNCNINSRFYDTFLELAADNNLQLSDINRLDNVFTYCSDGGCIPH